MPAPATLLLLATLAPLVAFGLLLAIGRRLGAPLAGWMATFFAGLSFAASLMALVIWCNPGGRHFHGVSWGIRERPIVVSAPWLPIGPGIAQDHGGFADIGIYIDSLTVAMFAMITLVGAAASAFAIGSMRGDADYPRFFLIHSLLFFAVLAIVLASSLLQILVFLGLAGLCVFLLVGYWNLSPAACHSGLRTYILLATSNVLLLIGIGLLAATAGNLSLPQLWSILGRTANGESIVIAGAGIVGPARLAAIGICLSLGAIGSAGQFPLHAWWTDATEAPSAAGVLLHAAGTGACAIYLLARVHPILTPDARLLLAIVGMVTITMSALIAVGQSDIRRAIAWVILAQVGYMALGLGVGSWSGAMFHLVTTGFIGSLLTLAGGAVVWATGGRRELSQFGGLWNRLPVTAAAFAVGALAMAGFPFFSGQISRMMILSDAGAFATLATATAGRSGFYWALFVLPALASYVIAFAMARCWMLTFVGRPRQPEVHQRAAEVSTLWTPLLILAVLSMFAGSLLGVGDLLAASIRESSLQMQATGKPDGMPAATTQPGSAGGFDQIWPARPIARAGAQQNAEDLPDVPSGQMSPAGYAQAHGEALARTWGRWAWLMGLLPGIIGYRRGHRIADRVAIYAPMRWLRPWLANEMYFAETYDWLFGRSTAALGEMVSWCERLILEPGLARLARFLRRNSS